jgi:hypothetical protein
LPGAWDYHNKEFSGSFVVSVSQPIKDPLYHVLHIRETMSQLQEHLRDDARQVDELQAKALFETSAEVIGGLIKAFEHYEHKRESAWV